MSPRVSVVIPCRDCAHFVANAVGSVLAQEEPGVEILVVDDGSREAAALDRALAPFGDRIRLLRYPPGGPALARNRGLEAATGEYVAFLDADDEWKRGFLGSQLALLEASGTDLVYCDAELFGPYAPEGIRTVMEEFPSVGDPTLEAILTKRCLVVMSTVVGRMEAVRAVGGFDPEQRFCEDLELWVRMLARGSSFAYSRQVWARRRIHDRNASRNAVAMVQGSLEIVERYRDHPALDRAARRRIGRHLRALRGEFHLERAKRRLAERDAAGARRDLWRAFRLLGNPKALVGAVTLSASGGAALEWLARRYQEETGVGLE